MHEEQNNRHENSGLMLNACLIEFVILLRRAMLELMAKKAGTMPLRRRVQAAVDFIENNLDRVPSVAELANKSHMSPSHFAHVFKAEMGLSPRDFIVAVRIEKAKSLLATTDMPAQDIAGVLGYDSPYFFYRQFKQKTGATALAFRAKYSAAEK
jgi:AraC-like DNA-binding protein